MVAHLPTKFAKVLLIVAATWELTTAFITTSPEPILNFDYVRNLSGDYRPHCQHFSCDHYNPCKIPGCHGNRNKIGCLKPCNPVGFEQPWTDVCPDECLRSNATSPPCPKGCVTFPRTCQDACKRVDKCPLEVCADHTLCKYCKDPTRKCYHYCLVTIPEKAGSNRWIYLTIAIVVIAVSGIGAAVGIFFYLKARGAIFSDKGRSTSRSHSGSRTLSAISSVRTTLSSGSRYASQERRDSSTNLPLFSHHDSVVTATTNRTPSGNSKRSSTSKLPSSIKTSLVKFSSVRKT